ncbi:acetolactate synthase large subunit [Microvirga arabica]|uniref:Acetolactate synthase large subunit n=1 Tax=Microvirga arabica TaxID=1128671 RepID=A0ABV6YBG2_9HYPH
MNGAESLVRTLAGGGVDVCFANPGTSEMHFVAALDQVEGIRSVLCLFEGVVTGAADGYARMTDKPAATLLHLGPGLANGLANLHNAKRARSPIVNIVGEHATFHRQYDAPLTSNIEALAGEYSGWLKTSINSRSVASDGASAVVAAMTPPGQIATLILPADTAWGVGGGIAGVPVPPSRAKVADERIRAAAEVLRPGRRTLLLLGDRSVRHEGLTLAACIGARTGAGLLAETSNARMSRGAGRPAIERVPYLVDAALKTLADYEHLILVGARPPVSFFGYPGQPSELQASGARLHVLADASEDQIDALARLADLVGAPARYQTPAPAPRLELPRSGGLDPASIAQVIGALLPENAIVCDESVTTGRNFFPATHGSAPHDWLQLTGGSIGLGIPLAIGAAVACPDRQVIALQADGSAMYTVQGLWTQARENLKVLTCIWSNRSYAILHGELAAVGVKSLGRSAVDLLSLDRPAIDWVGLSQGFGIQACRVETSEEFARAFRNGLEANGPCLIEVMI